jgi:hypothetical protein
MSFWNKFCGLIIFFFILTDFSYAQSVKQPLSYLKKNSLKMNFISFKQANLPVSKISFLNLIKEENEYGLFRNGTSYPLENLRTRFTSTIPANLATCNYAFFCRQELKIEKATNIPIRFRLGSLEQCDYYEGKH